VRANRHPRTTGAKRWIATYDGPGNGEDGDAAASLDVNRGGTRVFVTGSSDGGKKTGDDYATVAYDARLPPSRA
jgi:hypothetical protein